MSGISDRWKYEKSNGVPLDLYSGSIYRTVYDGKCCLDDCRYFNGLMALPNMIALFALNGVVVYETKKFFEAGKHKK